jgi:hypothetical protein
LTVRATTFLTLQSTYLGSGWFQYQMNVQDDPFFSEADIDGLFFNFTNQVDQSCDSTNWVYDTTNLDWSFIGTTYSSRPYKTTFLMQSSKTSYRLGTDTNIDGAIGAIIILHVDVNSFYPGASTGKTSFSGYTTASCLIPCDPDQADGSPTNCVYDVKLVPDVIINSLIQTNGNIYGVDFSWDSQSTFVFQGSTDMLNWTNITYIYSTPPETLWTTNTALNAYGQFFRVAIVADAYDTNLPPISSALTGKSTSQNSVSVGAPVVTGCKFSAGKIVVAINAQPGQNLQVQAIDRAGKVYQTQQVIAKSTSVSATFTAKGLPNPVYFQTALLP